MKRGGSHVHVSRLSGACREPPRRLRGRVRVEGRRQVFGSLNAGGRVAVRFHDVDSSRGPLERRDLIRLRRRGRGVDGDAVDDDAARDALTSSAARRVRQALAVPALGHRIRMSNQARYSGQTSADILESIIQDIKVPT